MPDDTAPRLLPPVLVSCDSSVPGVVTVRKESSPSCNGNSSARTSVTSICRLEYRAHVTHIAELASCIFDESGTSKMDRKSWTQHVLRPLREWSDSRGFYDETPFPVSVVRDILSAARSRGAHIPPLTKWEGVLVSEDVLQGSEPHKAVFRWMRWIQDDFEEVGTESDTVLKVDEHVRLSAMPPDKGKVLERAAGAPVEAQAISKSRGSTTQSLAAVGDPL